MECVDTRLACCPSTQSFHIVTAFPSAIDTMKTVLQVDSTEGFRNLLRRVGTGNFALLYQGAYATYVSSVLGHYPWVC
jgi:hypothetical protein